jgi:hypothetical protein
MDLFSKMRQVGVHEPELSQFLNPDLFHDFGPLVLAELSIKELVSGLTHVSIEYSYGSPIDKLRRFGWQLVRRNKLIIERQLI